MLVSRVPPSVSNANELKLNYFASPLAKSQLQSIMKKFLLVSRQPNLFYIGDEDTIEFKTTIRNLNHASSKKYLEKDKLI